MWWKRKFKWLESLKEKWVILFFCYKGDLKKKIFNLNFIFHLHGYLRTKILSFDCEMLADFFTKMTWNDKDFVLCDMQVSIFLIRVIVLLTHVGVFRKFAKSLLPATNVWNNYISCRVCFIVIFIIKAELKWT